MNFNNFKSNEEKNHCRISGTLEQTCIVLSINVGTQTEQKINANMKSYYFSIRNDKLYYE